MALLSDVWKRLRRLVGVLGSEKAKDGSDKPRKGLGIIGWATLAVKTAGAALFGGACIGAPALLLAGASAPAVGALFVGALITSSVLLKFDSLMMEFLAVVAFFEMKVRKMSLQEFAEHKTRD